MNREEDLRISSALVASEHGMWLKSKIQHLINCKEKEIEGHAYNAENEKLFLHQGIKIGLEIAKDLPEKIRKDSDKVIANYIKKMMGK